MWTPKKTTTNKQEMNIGPASIGSSLVNQRCPICPQACDWLSSRPLPSLLSPVFLVVFGGGWWDRWRRSVTGCFLHLSKTKVSPERSIGHASSLTRGRDARHSLDSMSLRQEQKRRFPNTVLYLFLCLQRVKIITATHATDTSFIAFVLIHYKTG